MRKGAVCEVVNWAREVGRNLSVCLVADKITRSLLGGQVETLLNKDGYRVRLCELPNGAGARPHVDESTLQVVEAALDGCDLALAVGAGTVSDLTKLGSFKKNIPYLAVATAPSMNGYTSAIAAILINGIKKTVPCHQPLAVIADLDIIQQAPKELIMAGLGDLESKPTACADYRLAGFVRGDYHCPLPEEVVINAEARVADAASGLDVRDPQAIEWLMEALLLSGISMKLAGSSGPASGGEHLISHFWDMTAAKEHRIEGWHGAQVGVATIVTATLYDRLQELDPLDLDIERLIAERPSTREIARIIDQLHGELAEEVTKEYLAKYLSEEDYSLELERIRSDWRMIWARLGDSLRPASRIRSILKSAGAPTTMTEIGLGPEHLKRALGAAHHIRSRFTVLDFANELGCLAALSEKALIDAVCSE